MDLKAFLLKNVGAEQFFARESEGFERGKNIVCPFHQDDTPSLAVDVDHDGRWICYGCKARGTSWIGYYTKKHGLDDDFKTALRRLYAEFIRPIVPQDEIDTWRETLLDTPSVLEWLKKKRGIRRETAELFHLGWDGYRLTIPVYTKWGFAVNVRKYDITKRSTAKIISYEKGYGAASLYPLRHHERGRRTYLFEGELDAILAHQCGFNAITSTGGAGSWSKTFSSYLEDADVTICFDVNDANDIGQRAAADVAATLRKVGCRTRIVRLPIDKVGGDFTDYFLEYGGTVEGFRLLEAEATTHEPIEEGEDEDEVPVSITLEAADAPEFFGRRIQLPAHAVGKGLQPYELPVKAEIVCESKPDKMCDFCTENGSYRGTIEFDPKDPSILQFADTTDEQRDARIRKLARCSGRCQTKITIKSVAAVEDVALVPVLDQNQEGGTYVLRRSFVVGRGLRSNQSYKFIGRQIPDPKTQRVTYLFEEAEPAYDSIESFRLTDSVRDELDQFRTSNIQQAQADRYEWYAKHVTQIYGRRDLHEAIDLVYFSPIAFNFNGRPIRKGWLEALVLGDTRTGKGYVAEGLQRFYGIGEVASAENCSFAGLVGGMQQLGTSRSWSITWGIIPRNDRRLVVLDEVSALSLDDIARMSRIRSEGVAEIVKIHSERTLARTRLIWLGNPRDERQIASHEHGVEAIQNLVGKSEDISRFDYGLVVAHDDVSSSTINSIRPSINGDRSRYDDLRRVSKALVLWAWSRTPDQIVFTDDATSAILRLVPVFAERYSPSIPLVQKENFGEKLAKVAAAVAARTFSASPDGETLRVTKDAVAYAAGFFQRLYNASNMAYDAYSTMERLTESMASEGQAASFFESFNERVPRIIEAMMTRRSFTVADLQMIFDLDPVTARETLQKLLELRVLKPQGNRYVKTSAAIKWFKSTYKAVQEQVSRTRSE